MLALGAASDLEEPPLWTWARLENGTPYFVALGMRQVVFTSPEDAYDARDILALSSKGAITPWRGAKLWAIHRSALTDTLRENFGDGLTDRQREAAITIDPSEKELRALAVLQVAFAADDPAVRNDARGAIENALVAGEIEGLIDVSELHALALRRLKRHEDNAIVSDAMWTQGARGGCADFSGVR